MWHGGHWQRLIIGNPTVFVPFLLSMVVIPWYNCEKSFLCFFAAGDCDSTFGCGVLIHLGGGQGLRRPLKQKSDSWYDISLKHPICLIVQGAKWLKIIFSLCQDRECVKLLKLEVVQIRVKLKRRPCKIHLTLPLSASRIKSNSAAKKVGGVAKKLEGLVCSCLKGRSHLICGSLQTTSNASASHSTHSLQPFVTSLSAASMVHNLLWAS